MCCIIYKPKGVQMPSLNTLAKIKRVNNHGYGFAATNGIQSYRYRSLNYERFLKHLQKVKTEEECIIHFRFATHGSVCLANCHPFENNGIYFAHNGVLNIQPYKDMTDSETAFRTILCPYIESYGIESEETENVIHDLIGYSKFAIICNQQVKLYGHFEKINNIYYSNLRWL